MLCKLEFFIVKPEQALGLRYIIKLKFMKMKDWRVLFVYACDMPAAPHTFIVYLYFSIKLAVSILALANYQKLWLKWQLFQRKVM